ncbi:MAG: hypothetical protein COA83_01340 [Methylophaga sp.]|nr:MAG: hypothetical protein COA83_01340 [Methylophaga sp.]
MRQFVKYSSVFAISMLLAVGLTGCGGGMFAADGPETEAEILQGQDGRILWEAQQGLQYVKIVDRDMAGPANEHPTAISVDELRTVLSSLYVNVLIGITRKELPLFSVGELQTLSVALANGLSQAQQNEDVNFVLNGKHRGLIASETKTNTGRVFIGGDGRLNIIFGLIHEEFRSHEKSTGQPIDRRLHPLNPGKRSFDSKPNVRVSIDKGQAYYLDPKTGKERTDWIVIDIATVLAEAANRKNDYDGTVSPELLEDVARSKQETGNLRNDVRGIKDILFEMSDEIERLKQQIEDLKAVPVP